MATTERAHRPHVTTVLRDEGRVTALELFFDLVFVLALTQCTALMAGEPTWTGLAKGVAVLGVMWWCWVGYTWLCSVVDPEEGSVRIVMFTAMAGLLLAALAIPDAFGDEALLFAIAYGIVRGMQLVLFLVASREDPGLHRAVGGLVLSTAIGVGLLLAASFADGTLQGSLWALALILDVGGLVLSTAVGVGLLLAASFADGTLQGALWALALILDVGGPLVIDPSGWRMNAEHFAERHGLIVIIALGESIVAIGVGAEAGVTFAVAVAAVLGVAVAAAQWWLYFDVVALVAARRLANAEPGREQNTMGRDSFSYLHFLLVAGIVLVALGMKKTLAHTGDELEIVPAAALYGGASLYLLAHVAFRWRNIHTLNRQRLAVAIALLPLIAVAVAIPSLAALAILAVTLCALVGYEAIRFGEARERLRRRLLHESPA